MRSLFLHLVNMSITASWLILAIIVYRVIFKKAPKWIATTLWCLVGLRLICPITFESRFSVIPSESTFVVEQDSIVIESGFSGVDSTINAYLEGAKQENVVAHENSMGTVFAIIWMVGAFVLLSYSLVSYARLKGNIRDAVKYSDRVFQSEKIDSPFVLGIFRPIIYMSYGLSEDQISCVLQHERAHIKRRDHLIKPLGFLLLCLYWFNPFVWVAYILLCNDIELACDERVIREIGFDKKKMYSQTLLACSIPRRMIMTCPVAFAEVGVKERVLNIMKMKKARKGIVALALVGFVALTVMFMTKPFEDKSKEDTATQIVYSEAAEADFLASEVQDSEEHFVAKIYEVPYEEPLLVETMDTEDSDDTTVLDTSANDTAEVNAEVEVTEMVTTEVEQIDNAQPENSNSELENQTNGNTSVSVRLVNPVAGSGVVTAGFSANHQAVDYAGPQGTPLVATIDGTVVAVGCDDANGNYLVIQASDGTKVYYNNCDSILVGNGASVTAGSEVATMGNTGNSTGPHLHFAVSDASGVFVDPLSLMQ